MLLSDLEKEELTAVEYLKALKHNIRNGIPIKGYLGKTTTPKKIDEINILTEEFSVQLLDNSYKLYIQQSKNIEKRINKLISVAEKEEINASTYFSFFKEFNRLIPISNKHLDSFDKLVSNINSIPKSFLKLGMGKELRNIFSVDRIEVIPNIGIMKQ